MRILHVDKFLRRSGGAAIYMLDTAARQEALGHQVEFFAMQDGRNVAATYEDLFPGNVPFDAPQGAKGRALLAGRMVWSPSAARKMADVIERRVRHPPGEELVNPIDVTAVVPREGPGDGFAFIGRLNHQKGVHVAIRAIGQVEGARLTVAGEGPDRDALERLAEEVAPGRVTFVGQLDFDGVAALNRSARAAVTVVQGHQSMPLSVLETMGAGVPLVVSRLGGLPEMVHDQVEGLVVPHDDVTAIAAAIRRLHSDPELSITLGRNGRARAERDFAVGPHLERLIELYGEAGAPIG